MSNITFQIHAAGHHLRVQEIQVSEGSKLSDRPVLVFLHEGLGCIEMWRDFPERVCRETGCTGIVYDRKGYGESDEYEGTWPVDYLVEEAARDLRALLAACKVKESILIGHSDGGSIALLAAADSEMGPAIRGIATIAAHVFVEHETTEGIRNFMKIYESTDLKEKLRKYHKENTDTVVRRWADTWLNPEFRDWNIESVLSRITCPALIIQGTEDEYATLAQVEKIVRQVSGPVTSELISGCGHAPHFESTRQTLAVISDFIAAITPNR